MRLLALKAKLADWLQLLVLGLALLILIGGTLLALWHFIAMAWAVVQ